MNVHCVHVFILDRREITKLCINKVKNVIAALLAVRTMCAS